MCSPSSGCETCSVEGGRVVTRIATRIATRVVGGMYREMMALGRRHDVPT